MRVPNGTVSGRGAPQCTPLIPCGGPWLSTVRRSAVTPPSGQGTAGEEGGVRAEAGRRFRHRHSEGLVLRPLPRTPLGLRGAPSSRTEVAEGGSGRSGPTYPPPAVGLSRQWAVAGAVSRVPEGK